MSAISIYLYKSQVTFEIATFRASLFPEGRHFRDLLTTLKFYCYFGGSLLLAGVITLSNDDGLPFRRVNISTLEQKVLF